MNIQNPNQNSTRAANLMVLLPQIAAFLIFAASAGMLAAAPTPEEASDRIYTEVEIDKRIGKQANLAERKKKLEELAARGDARAMLTCGFMKLDGKGGDKDKAGAVELFRKAAEAGSRAALVELAYSYINGDGVEKDPAKGFKYFREAAEKGSDWARFEMAKCMEHGVGTEKSKSALVEYGRAARRGIGAAQIRLGEINRDDGKRGNALHWFRMAANQGEAEAYPNLAGLLLSEEAQPSERAEGIRWLKKAAEIGNGWALWRLGEIHLHGDFGEQQDRQRAFDCFTRSHKAGFPAGAGMLGYCYKFGYGTAKNEKTAVELFELAHAAGDETATISLAVSHNGGEGVSQDRLKAIKLLTPIASKGHPWAQYNLAVALFNSRTENGSHDWKKEVEARDWLQKAAKQGFSPARELLKERVMKAPAEMYKEAGGEEIRRLMKHLPSSENAAWSPQP